MESTTTTLLDTPVWVHLFEVTREYGGPEEGGWWYNLYVPVQATAQGPFFDRGEAWDAAHTLQVFADVENKVDNPRGIYSVIGGADRVWSVQDTQVPTMSPAEQPHYE